MYKILLAVLLAVTFIGCEDEATFSGPQPVDSEALTEIPKKLWGNYLSEDHASTLSVNAQQLIRTYDFDSKTHKDSLGKEYFLSGTTLIDPNDQLKEAILIDGDTIIRHDHWIDTVFRLDNNHVAKAFKGYCFLNISVDDTSWITQKVALRKGMLTISHIAGGADLAQLQTLTDHTDDTLYRHFTLKKKTFKKFVRQHGFRNEERFARMK